MKKYDDFKDIASVDWTKYKIIVPTQKDKEELIEAFNHFHYSDIDTDYVTVNQLAHEYLDGSNIIVSKNAFSQIENL